MSPRLLKPRAAASTAFDPRQIAGLGLWLDAADTSTVTLNAGNVSEWRDKSGNGRHASQSTAAFQPLYQAAGTLPVAVVNESSAAARSLTIPGALGLVRNVTGGTLIAVHRPLAIATGQQVFMFSSGTNAFANRLGLAAGATAAALEFGGRRLDSNSFQAVGNNSGTANTPYVHVGVVNYTNATATMYVNGIVAASSSSFQTGGNSDNTDSLAVSLFNNGGGTSVYPGAIAEVLVYPRALSAAEVSAISRYLGAKWGIAVTPYSPPSYADADVNAYITAVETADGQELEAATRNAINNFIVGCKTDGIWSAIRASCILMGARTLSGALTPLVGTAPTNQNFVSGDYNRKTGLLGNNVNKAIKSNRAENADPLNNNHIAVHLTTLGPGFMALNGSFTTAITDFSTRNRSANHDFFTPSVGFIGISRDNASNYLRRFGGSTSTIARASATSDSSTYDLNTGAHRLAFYSIGQSLDLALLNSRVSTLVSAIGAAIP